MKAEDNYLASYCQWWQVLCNLQSTSGTLWATVSSKDPGLFHLAGSSGNVSISPASKHPLRGW